MAKKQTQYDAFSDDLDNEFEMGGASAIEAEDFDLEPRPTEAPEPDDEEDDSFSLADDEPEPTEAPTEEPTEAPSEELTEAPTEDPRIAQAMTAAAEAKADAESARAAAKKAKEDALLAQRIGLEEMGKNIAAQLDGVTAQLIAAKEEGDSKKEVELLNKMTELQGKKSRVESHLQTLPKEVTEAPPPAKPAPKREANPAYTEKVNTLAKAWIAKNTWYTNPKHDMEAAHVEVIYNEMLAEKLDPATNGFYAEADKRLAKKFPHLYQRNTKSAAPALKKPVAASGSGVAAPSSAATPTPKSKTYTFSATEKEFIRTIGKADDKAFIDQFARGLMARKAGGNGARA